MRSFVNYTDSGGAAFLASRAPCWVAELFTHTLVNGAVFRWTSFDRSLTVAGHTWLASRDGGPLITRNRFGVKNTVEVPELELRLGCSDTLLSNLKTQIHNGIWDGARVEMDRVFMPSPGDTQFGYVLMFNGRQSGAVIDAEGITLTAKGDNVLMNQQAPRNLYQTNCLHTFCDAGCTLSESAYSFAGLTVGTGSTASSISFTVPAGFTIGQFVQGKVTMTSGAASGQVRSVRNAGGTWLNLTYPLYDAPAPGDTFNLLLGCERTQTACEVRTPVAGGTVNNIQHFRGYPYVPQAEIAV
jgi:uncharacterized phage protein (TIGR02218 family)